MTIECPRCQSRDVRLLEDFADDLMAPMYGCTCGAMWYADQPQDERYEDPGKLNVKVVR
jgi:hypothetical protein